MYQSLNLKYNFVNCIIQTYHACISFEFNLSISWLFPRDIPCQEDAISLLSYLIFIILILRQAWKSRTVIKSPSGFAESLWRLEKGLGKDNLQQIHSFQIRFSNMTSLRETGQALLLKSLQIYCCIHDLTTNMRYCLLPSAAQDADALPSAANWHQRGEQAPMMCCGSCVAHVADKPFPFGSFGGAVCLFVFALFSCVFFVCFAFFLFPGTRGMSWLLKSSASCDHSLSYWSGNSTGLGNAWGKKGVLYLACHFPFHLPAHVQKSDYSRKKCVRSGLSQIHFAHGGLEAVAVTDKA